MNPAGCRLFVLTLLLAGTALAFVEPGAAQATGEELRVSLVTMGPGPNYWERFGHNAILVENTTTRGAALYNYGVFDFRKDSFLLNFLRGRMQYQLMPFDPTRDFARYVEADRDVRIQYLALTAQQRLNIAGFLDWNARPENAAYRYDYFLDNCSTRIRDVLDEALGGALRRATEDKVAQSTYRFHAERMSANEELMYLGLRLVLGRPVDKPISRWEEMYIPSQLYDAVAQQRVETEAGEDRPLVEREWHLHASDKHAAPFEPPYTPWLAFAVGSMLTLWMVWAAQGPKASIRRRLYAVSHQLWLALSGIAGLFLAWFAFGSDHGAAHYNENLLLLSPIALVPLLWRRGPKSWVYVMLAVMAMIALALKVMPGSQSNLSVILAIAPIQLGMLWISITESDPSFGT